MNASPIDGAHPQECELLVGQLFAPEPAADPYPLYDRLRELAPVHHSQAAGAVLVSGYRHVTDVLHRSEIGYGPDEKNLIRQTPGFEFSPYLQMIATAVTLVDAPTHTRLRKLLSRAFTPKAIANSRSAVESIVEGVLDEAAQRGEFDVVADVAKRIPVQVIGSLLGLPAEDHADIVRWTDAVANAVNPVATEEMLTQANKSAISFADYAAGLAAERRKNPGEDLVSALVSRMDDEGALTPEEFATQLMAIVSAGTETIIGFIANSTVALQQHPDQRTRLREDPSADTAAVEELLRYDPPLQLTFPRVALEDQEIGGVPVPAGTQVISVLGAACRDPEAIERPGEFDISRVRPPALTQLAFGSGIHFCLGAPLARLEGQVVIRAMLDRFPSLEVDLTRARRVPNPMIRAYASAPATTGN